MVVRNFGWMVACVCLVGALGCHKHKEPASSSIPVITSFSPASGNPTDVITVFGSGFDGTSNVSVGGAWAVFTHINDGELTFTVPYSAATGIIAIVNGLGSGGTSGLATPDFYVIPTIISFSPLSGGPGTAVTVTGYGLSSTQQVGFGGSSVTPQVNSANLLTAYVPLGASSGSVSITVLAPPPAGSSTPTTATASLPGFTFVGGAYTVPAFAAVNPFTPTQAKVGDTVAVNGTGMASVSAVTIGGVPSPFKLVNDTQLQVSVPQACVSGSIALTSLLATTPVTLPGFLVAPGITSFTPPQGPAGTLVTVIGSGLVGTTSIALGGAASSNFLVTGPNSAQFNVAPGSTTGLITLVASGIPCQSLTSFTLAPSAANPPAITGIVTPSATTVVFAGDSVTIKGSGFTGVSEVTLGTVPAAVTASTDTQITFTVPPGAISGFIAVTTGAGGAAGSAGTYQVNPTITALSLSQGPVGTALTLTGTGFNGATAVAFNGTPAAFVVQGPNQISTQVPAGATTGSITVVASGLTGTSGSFSVQ